MDEGGEVLAARHFVASDVLERVGQLCRPRSGHNAVANIGELQASANAPLVLHWPGEPGPEATVTAVGLRVAKNATKSKAPIPNVKTVRACFILAPKHFPV